ncbi:MAG: ATP-binding protein [Enterobacteriaceae bacterium]
MGMTLSERLKQQQSLVIGCIVLFLLLLILLHYWQYQLLQQLEQEDKLHLVWSFIRLDIAMMTVTVLLLSLMAVVAVLAWHNMRVAQVRRELAELLNHSLDQALQDARAGSRSKTLFLANMSHEVRTPLSGLLGMIESLLQDTLQPQQRESLQLIHSSAQALLVTLTDILDYSRLEEGKNSDNPYPLNKHAFMLRALLGEILYPFSLRASKQGIALHWQIMGSVPELIYSDPFRLRQVLNNLLDNALKFTARGEITVTVCVREGQSVSPTLLFTVMDSGIGIAYPQQNLVFDPFTQADNAIGRHYGGTGLGLAISRALVCLLGGQIWLESEPGKGTTFYFTLPLEQEPAGGMAQKQITSADDVSAQVSYKTPLQLLLVEDNLLNQTWAQILLQQQGHYVTLAANGEEALQQLARQPFDLILMDVQMPGQDGLAVTREIRHREQQIVGHTPIIAMTAHVLQGDRERCLAAGMDGYISKPIDSEQLKQEIARVLCLF